MKQPSKANLQDDHEKGTPAALRVIAEQEAESRKDHASAKAGLDEAIANQLLNPDDEHGNTRVQNARNHLDDVEKRWQRWLKHLREFDKAVDPSKRDAEEKISKSEAIQLCKMITIYGNNAYQSFGTRFITEARNAKNEQEAWTICGEAFVESLLGSIKVAVSEAHLPPYALEAVEGVL